MRLTIKGEMYFVNVSTENREELARGMQALFTGIRRPYTLYVDKLDKYIADLNRFKQTVALYEKVMSTDIKVIKAREKAKAAKVLEMPTDTYEREVDSLLEERLLALKELELSMLSYAHVAQDDGNKKFQPVTVNG